MSGERPLRLFVALELPEAAVAALAAFRDGVVGDVWRPVADAALHVTLAFLGRRPPSAVEACAAVVEAAASARDVPHGRDATSARHGPGTREAAAPRRVPLALGDPVLLPPRRTRVLAVAVADPAGALAALQARVSDGLAAAGLYEPEARPFRGHVTVARVRARAIAPRTVDGAPDPVAFAATAVTLFVSRLHPAGARYEALARVSLPDH